MDRSRSVEVSSTVNLSNPVTVNPDVGKSGSKYEKLKMLFRVWCFNRHAVLRKAD
jgi:hypothetical protein